MNKVNRDELIAVYGEYVALLEKELATGKPVSVEDTAKGNELKTKIASIKQLILNEPK